MELTEGRILLRMSLDPSDEATVADAAEKERSGGDGTAPAVARLPTTKRSVVVLSCAARQIVDERVESGN